MHKVPINISWMIAISWPSKLGPEPSANTAMIETPTTASGKAAESEAYLDFIEFLSNAVPCLLLA